MSDSAMTIAHRLTRCAEMARQDGDLKRWRELLIASGEYVALAKLLDPAPGRPAARQAS